MTPSNLDAHAKPPVKIREIYKHYQKSKGDILVPDPNLVRLDAHNLPTELRQIFSTFLADSSQPQDDVTNTSIPEIYASSSIPGSFPLHHLLLTHYNPKNGKPGLTIYPSLFSPPVQLTLLSKLLHRDISNPQHQTNVHLFHTMVYPPSNASFFSPSATNLTFTPLDPSVHKPISLPQFLNKKLRWATLGGQYDWTNKVYPSSSPPPAFPADIKALIESIFPMKAEAAILNLYSPGDTLSLHRDVSEECDRPLVSISLGCDAIFIVGLDEREGGEEAKVEVLRLKSGDAVLMSGASRYAWHGVPRVVGGTCPEWMRDWPGSGQGSEYEAWKGWMSGKRINLNVRQMFA